MKRLKLFPKIFLYTMSIMLFVVVVTHGLIYLLAPQMQLALSTQDDVVVSIRQEQFVTEAVEKALPISLSCSLLISVVCSLLFSKIASRNLYPLKTQGIEIRFSQNHPQIFQKKA